MIDESKRAQVRRREAVAPDIEFLSIEELHSLRADIDRLLPNTDNMNLHKELAAQYELVKGYQAHILTEDGVEPNKVAQVMNTTVATLGHLIKLQETLERAETLKRMEACLIEALQLLTEEAKTKFFEEYEALAASRGVQ